MNIFECIKKIYPDWSGIGWGTAYEGIKPHELETRPIPTLAELKAVWPEVQAEIITERKRSAYKAEADPIFVEWQALLAAGHEDAEGTKLKWLAKREEIGGRTYVDPEPEKPATAQEEAEPVINNDDGVATREMTEYNMTNAEDDIEK